MHPIQIVTPAKAAVQGDQQHASGCSGFPLSRE